MLALRAALATELEFQHLTRKFQSGIKDSKWVPALAAEKGWTIITGDSGRNSAKGQKLPDLCTVYGVTYILLGKSLHNSRVVEKIAALGFVWPKIVDAARGPSGLGFVLRTKEAPNGAGKVSVHGLALWCLCC